MSLRSVLDEQLREIVISEADISKIRKIADDFVGLLESKKLEAHIGGSLAKGTMVVKEGLQDVDIFVVFDYSEGILGLEKILKKLRLPGSLKKVHGSRDYFQVECSDVLLEIIPVVRNNNPELAENVTDVSLSHVKYVRGMVEKNSFIADEIRLSKAFARANRCYGAESYIKGFSGYSLEVLTIYFGSFEKLLKGISKNRVIDPLKYFKSSREVLMELNSSKLQGPLVLVDPTYKYRNISAGLGFETYEKFCDLAKKFLKKPSGDFFVKKDLDVEELKSYAKKIKAKFVEIDLFTDRQEGDIAGTKMKKLFDFFASELLRKQQVIHRKEFVYSGIGKSARGYLVVEEKSVIEIRGPQEGMNVPVRAFREAKGDKAFLKKGFWWYRESVSLDSVFELVKKVEKDIGASIRRPNTDD